MKWQTKVEARTSKHLQQDNYWTLKCNGSAGRAHPDGAGKFLLIDHRHISLNINYVIALIASCHWLSLFPSIINSLVLIRFNGFMSNNPLIYNVTYSKLTCFHASLLCSNVTEKERTSCATEFVNKMITGVFEWSLLRSVECKCIVLISPTFFVYKHYINVCMAELNYARENNCASFPYTD